MPTVIVQPSKGAFHFPAVLYDLAPLAGVLDAFHSNLVRLLQAADPVAQPLRLIPAIDPDFPEAGHAGGKIPLQQRSHWCSVSITRAHTPVSRQRRQEP